MMTPKGSRYVAECTVFYETVFDGYLFIPYLDYTQAPYAILLDCTLPCLQ
jgi:hypothetical protein